MKQRAKCEYPQINERRKAKAHYRQTGFHNQRRLHSADNREPINLAEGALRRSTILPRNNIETIASDHDRPNGWAIGRITSSVADPDNQREASTGSVLREDQVHLMRQPSIPTDVSWEADESWITTDSWGFSHMHRSFGKLRTEMRQSKATRGATVKNLPCRLLQLVLLCSRYTLLVYTMLRYCFGSQNSSLNMWRAKFHHTCSKQYLAQLHCNQPLFSQPRRPLTSNLDSSHPAKIAGIMSRPNFQSLMP